MIDPAPRLGSALALIVAGRETIAEAYSARLERGADVYGVSSRRELVEVLDNIASAGTPLGGRDLIVLDARGPGLSAKDAIGALSAAGWSAPAFELRDDDTAFSALTSGPALVLVVREAREATLPSSPSSSSASPW